MGMSKQADIGRMWAKRVIANMGLREKSRCLNEYETAKKRIDKLGLDGIGYEAAIKLLTEYLGI